MNLIKAPMTLRNGLLMAISVLQVSCSMFGVRSEETPKYEVLQSDGKKEIRAYSSYIVAKTTVQGEFKKAQGDAFRILAGYIFGGNEKKQNISMTAPVRQQPASENEKLAMTAPVVQTSTERGWVMTFMMPSKYRLEDLPTPKDSRVTFEVIAAKTFAVIRYSGFSSEKTNNEKQIELRDWIVANGQYEIIGAPSIAGYDPPWTLPFLRRNEAMYEVKTK